MRPSHQSQAPGCGKSDKREFSTFCISRCWERLRPGPCCHVVFKAVVLHGVSQGTALSGQGWHWEGKTVGEEAQGGRGSLSWKEEPTVQPDRCFSWLITSLDITPCDTSDGMALNGPYKGFSSWGIMKLHTSLSHSVQTRSWQVWEVVLILNLTLWNPALKILKLL